MVSYEEQLDRDLQWALREGSMHFEKESAVHKTLTKITQRLKELNIPYAVVGSMALFVHGYRRFTEDVDLLVTRESLKTIHEKLEGLGYLPPFPNSRHLRDTETGVRVEFIVTGDYPGESKPKPVAFPDPAYGGQTIENMQVVRLSQLIELKLASGLNNPKGAKDLVDVQELIDKLQLPEKLADNLHPYVRDRYLELWRIVNSPTEPPQ